MNRAQALLAEAIGFHDGRVPGQLLIECTEPRCRARRQFPGLTKPQAERMAAREGWREAPGGWLCRHHAGGGRRQDDLFAGGRAGP